MLKVISGQGNANQNHEIPHPPPLGWLESQSQIRNVGEDVEGPEAWLCWRESKMGRLLWKAVGQSLQMLNTAIT